MVKRKRKSPIRHNVKSHIRDNKRISSYVRGKGTRTIPTLTHRRKIIKTDEPKSFLVNFTYSNRKGDGEIVPVISTSYEKALKEAFENKVDKREPIQITVDDPDFGRIFKAIGQGAAKIAKVGVRAAVKGAKYAYRGAEVFGKAAAEEVSKRLQNYEEQLKAQKLIRESYAVDRTKRLLARAKLKKEFPEIYEVCDFSRPSEDRAIEIRVKAESVQPRRRKRKLPPAKVPPTTKQVYEEIR